MTMPDPNRVPVSIDGIEPCGPDLDEAGDGDYLDLVAGLSQKLPQSFYSRPQGSSLVVPYDRSQMDLDSEGSALHAVLNRTLDLRLLSPVAQLTILGGDVERFCRWIVVMVRLVDDHWHDVHPRGIDGDFVDRAAAFEVLDGKTTVLLPLQYAPLLVDKKAGTLTLRHHLLAAGLQPAREGEPVPDPTTVRDVLRRVEHRTTLVALADAVSAAIAAVRSIPAIFGHKTNYGTSANCPGLLETLHILQSLLSDAVGQTVATKMATSEIPTTARIDTVLATNRTFAGPEMTDRRTVDAALAAVERYYIRYEPSHPSVVLVRQSREMVGRSLASVTETMLPSITGAKFDLGNDIIFHIDLARMTEMSDKAAAELGDDDTGGVPDIPEIRSRADAVSMMDFVERTLLLREPSSPLPLLLRKARDLAQREFADIVKEIYG